VAGIKVGQEIREKILEFEKAAIQELKNKI